MRFAIRGSEVTVPTLVGMTVQEGNQLLGRSELRLKVESHRFHESVQSDRIISQTPSPGSTLKKNRNVRIVVSLGAKKVQVSDFRGESLRSTQIALLRRGLSVGITSGVHSETVEKDRVLSQDPPPQMQVSQAPLVNLLVSNGRRHREFLMPDLTGLNVDLLSNALTDAGLRFGTLTYHSLPGLDRGTILKQYPPVGHKVVEGDLINLEICN